MSRTTSPAASLIPDFLTVALGNHVDRSDIVPHALSHRKAIGVSANDYQANVRRRHPSLAPYVLRDAGLPINSALSRWEDSIVVAIGWPGKKPITPDDSTSAIIKDQIDRLAETLTSITGIKITFFDVSDARSSDLGEPNLWILPFGTDTQDNFFRTRRNAHYDINSAAAMIFGEVHFSPESNTQVEGFYVTDTANVIKNAFCNIFPFSHNPSLFRALITECIVRSMGLANTYEGTEPSILSAWNRSMESLTTPASEINPLVQTQSPSEMNAYSTTFHNAISVPDIDALPAYDRILLKTLYCDALSPGMDRNRVIWTLSQEHECF